MTYDVLIFGNCITERGKKGEGRELLKKRGFREGWTAHQLSYMLRSDALQCTGVDFLHREMLGMMKLVYFCLICII